MPRFLFLEGLVYDLHQFLIHVLGPAFDRDELAVHDGNAVGVDGEQQLVILRIIIVAHGDGPHRELMAVGGIVLVELFAALHAGEQFGHLLIDCVVRRKHLILHLVGADKVLGVIMPNYKQDDIDVAYDICQHVLNIDYLTINIGSAYDEIIEQIDAAFNVTDQTLINLAPRLRMTTLYGVSQSHNGRVVNTCNLSEDYIGYSTRYGDAAGDFSPLAQFTKSEVKRIGYYLGLPKKYIEKTPSDGLCGKSDEDSFGFTYAVLDRYIRTGICDDPEIKRRIDRLHTKNKFKLKPMQYFNYKEEKTDMNMSPDEILKALEKAVQGRYVVIKDERNRRVHLTKRGKCYDTQYHK